MKNQVQLDLISGYKKIIDIDLSIQKIYDILKPTIENYSKINSYINYLKSHSTNLGYFNFEEGSFLKSFQVPKEALVEINSILYLNYSNDSNNSLNSLEDINRLEFRFGIALLYFKTLRKNDFREFAIINIIEYMIFEVFIIARKLLDRLKEVNIDA